MTRTKSEREKPTCYPLVSLLKLERLLNCDRGKIQALASTAGNYYRPFFKTDPRNGKQRQIDNPIEPLKSLQRRIKQQILDTMPLPPGVVGGVKGRRLRDNLTPHVGKFQVSCLDIRNCFPSISNKRVYSIYTSFFGCSPTIASLLTRLTTFWRCLPQGASTSTGLAILALLPLYEDLVRLLEPMGLRVTIWIDDITISGSEHRQVIGEVVRRIQSHGFSVRNKKLLILFRHHRQWVTGATVNRALTIGQDRRRNYRADLMKLDPRSRSDFQKGTSKILFVRSLAPRQADSLQRFWKKQAALKTTDS